MHLITIQLLIFAILREIISMPAIKETCFTDSQCEKEEFCLIFRGQNGVCSNCLNCTNLKRVYFIELSCPQRQSDCGACNHGYEEIGSHCLPIQESAEEILKIGLFLLYIIVAVAILVILIIVIKLLCCQNQGSSSRNSKISRESSVLGRENKSFLGNSSFFNNTNNNDEYQTNLLLKDFILKLDVIEDIKDILILCFQTHGKWKEVIVSDTVLKLIPKDQIKLGGKIACGVPLPDLSDWIRETLICWFSCTDKTIRTFNSLVHQFRTKYHLAADSLEDHREDIKRKCETATK